ncbi:MAG: hypothetical protein U9R52_01415 [Candidatus Omnitrophota bacterium]|nr:hypothetical protein [Candidatus Omnitrophota bacterium]
MSIIAEALKKLEKEKKGTISSKEYLHKILGPVRNSTFTKEKEENGDAPDITYRKRSKSLTVSGILLILTIAFLTAANIFLVPSFDTEMAESGRPADPAKEAPVAEAYTDVKTEIFLIENKTEFTNKAGLPLKNISIRDEFMSNFKLSGIAHDAVGSWAIVNDRIIRVGDHLDGAEIVSVVSDKVTFIYKNEKLDLTVE